MHTTPTTRYVRNTDNKIVAGICAAIAERTGWDVNLVRSGTALAAILTSGTVLLIYLVLWAVIPAAGAETTVLSEVLSEGRTLYEKQKERGNPSAQPGPAPQTPHPQTQQTDPTDPFDLYRD